jgi:hypothetical protein
MILIENPCPVKPVGKNGLARKMDLAKSQFGKVGYIDIESLQNRLLKVCYVSATSADPPMVSFFFSFLFLLLQPLTVLIKQTR